MQTISTKDLQNALAQAANNEVKVPESARAACDAAPLPAYTNSPAEALGEARAYGTLQTGYLDICDKRRKLAVDAADLHNQGVKKVVNELRPLRWWERIIGRARPSE